MTDTDRPNPAEFSNWLWGLRYRVDAEGITELDRHGNQHCFIPWRELERTGPTLVGRGGQVIALRLGKKQTREFLHAACTEWQARYPDAYRRDEERVWRSFRWVTFWGLPLYVGVPLAALWALVAWRRASGLPHSLWAGGLLTLFVLILISVLWGLYFLCMRPEHERRMRDAGKTVGPQPRRERM
jgi:hypothetical protein